MNNNIPQTMKAVLLTEGGATLKVEEIAVPKPGPGEVLVKIHASPINPSDLAFLAGGYGIQKKFPAVPGFEGSGIVVAAGKGFLPKLWLGKKVACAASVNWLVEKQKFFAIDPKYPENPITFGEGIGDHYSQAISAGTNYRSY